MRTIKQICAGLIASAFAFSTYATTLNPIQLLNPAGSAAGQSIVSTGAATPPAWGFVTLSGITGTLAIANGGTGAATQATALTALLGASTVPIANGGTGQATQSAALSALLGSSAIPVANGGTGNTSASAEVTRLGAAVTSGTLAQFANGGAINPASTGGATPGTGAFTTLSATGLITPTSTIGIKATSTNDNPASGSFGEYAKGSATATSLTSGSTAACATLSLTPGDWDVTGIVQTTPAGTTTTSNATAGISTASNGFIAVGSPAVTNTVSFPVSLAAGVGVSLMLPPTRMSVASTTSVYSVLQVTFATSTMACSGFLQARRAPH